MIFSRLLLVGCAIGLWASTAARASVAFVPPGWARPTSIAQASSSLTTYQHWDVFTSAAGTSPDAAMVNPGGVPIAFDANYPSSGTIVTTTGNLYAGSGIIRMNVVVPNYSAASERTRFLVQIKTIGSALFDSDGVWPVPPVETDFSRLKVNGQSVALDPSFQYAALNVAPGSGPTSFDVERAITFDLPGNAAEYTIEWSTARGSCSQMEIAVDTFVVVPEPTLLGIVAAVPFALRQRLSRTNH